LIEERYPQITIKIDDKKDVNQKIYASWGGVWKALFSQTLGFYCNLIFSAPRGGELYPNYY
jgi:hypothetical protein